MTSLQGGNADTRNPEKPNYTQIRMQMDVFVSQFCCALMLSFNRTASGLYSAVYCSLLAQDVLIGIILILNQSNPSLSSTTTRNETPPLPVFLL